MVQQRPGWVVDCREAKTLDPTERKRKITSIACRDGNDVVPVRQQLSEAVPPRQLGVRDGTALKIVATIPWLSGWESTWRMRTGHCTAQRAWRQRNGVIPGWR